MKKALLFAPMGSVHSRFNGANIDALKELGYEVHLAANFSNGAGSEQNNGDFVKKCNEKGIFTHHIPFARAVALKNLFCIRDLKKLIRDNQYDIVHAHTETGGLLLRLAMLGEKKNYKAIYTPHGMSFYKGSGLISQICYRPIEYWICSVMDTNIAINGEEYSVLKQWNEKSACFVHGIGLDLSRFSVPKGNIRQELGISEETILIVSVGELNENKNHRIVIEALAELKDKNFCYAICGAGDLHDFLLAKAEKNGITDKVKLLGYRQDIPEILASADIFAFPSYHEGLPVSVIEAMASGLPIVASAIRGNNDLIMFDENGFLCNPDSVEDFTVSLQKLIDNPNLRNKNGCQNQGYVCRYSAKNVINELKKVYI